MLKETARMALDRLGRVFGGLLIRRSQVRALVGEPLNQRLTSKRDPSSTPLPAVRCSKVAVGFAFLFLGGCAGGSQVLQVPDSAPETVAITWVRVPPEQIDFYCHKAKVAYGAAVHACAEALGPRCTIYTTREASLELIGHEVAHCYLGAWH
jgi:hypothetical protein